MFKLLLILLSLVSVCVVIHGLGTVIGLRWLGRIVPAERHCSLPATFWILSRLVFGLLVMHILQILAWAACYHWYGCFADFSTSFYYSATSYSTVGYGDVIPPGNWRIVGSIEAVTGVLMFGWSTGVLFAVVNKLISRFTESSRHRAPRA
ncbi:MAG: potassium channel family protein [Akkermansiaceae bacterium]|nr:potassium channel family protein [Akkermansiaceae bacterium]